MGRWANIFADEQGNESFPDEAFAMPDTHPQLVKLLSAHGPPPPLALGEQGACRGLSTAERDELFFNDGPNSRFYAKQARERFCGGCPVMVQCRDYARSVPSLEGVWGGETAWQRAALRQPHRQAKKVERDRKRREAQQAQQLQRDRQAAVKRTPKVKGLKPTTHSNAKPIGVRLRTRQGVDKTLYEVLTSGVVPRLYTGSTYSMTDALGKMRQKVATMPELVAAVDAKLTEMQSSLDDDNQAA